jgi:dCTP diphosphatase
MSFDLTAAADEILAFAVERDWVKFHNPKNLVMAIAGEVGELAEILQWKNEEETASLLSTANGKDRIEEEVADIAIYLIRLSQEAGIDLQGAILRKTEKNRLKYPADISRGSSLKYTERTES